MHWKLLRFLSLFWLIHLTAPSKGNFLLKIEFKIQCINFQMDATCDHHSNSVAYYCLNVCIVAYFLLSNMIIFHFPMSWITGDILQFCSRSMDRVYWRVCFLFSRFLNDHTWFSSYGKNVDTRREYNQLVFLFPFFYLFFLISFILRQWPTQITAH